MKSKIRKILQLVLTFVMLLSFSLCVACGDDDGEFEEETLSYELTVRVGETRYLDFYAVSNGALYEISVSDTSVISVDANIGKMDALKVGSSVITQTFGVTTATWNITVVESNFVPEVEGEEAITGNQDLDIAVPYLKTTVGGITTVSSVLKFVNANGLVWSVENANVIKIVPSADKKSCQVIGLAVGNSKLYLSNGVIKDVIDVEVKSPKDTHVQDANKNTVVKFDTISLKTKVGIDNVIRLVTDENVKNAVWSIVSGNDFVSIATSADNKECYVKGLAIGVATVRAQIGNYFAECQVLVASDSLITLGAVELVASANTLSWTAVPNASGYEYSSDGGYRWEDVPNGALSYTVPQDYPSGKYAFMVRAKGDGLNYKSGAYDTADIITSLYTEIDLDTKTVSWTEYQGASSYSIFVNGQETVLNSGDYAVEDGEISYVVSELSRNEEIYVSANGKNGNTVYYIGEDLGLVVLYSGIGNSNPKPMFLTHETVTSIKIDGVEKPFLVEDGKVSVQEYSGVEFGKKLPVTMVVGGKTINSNKVFVDRVLFAGNTNYVSPEANFVNNLNTNYYFKNKAINKIADKQYEYVVNDADSLVIEVGGVTITRSAKVLLDRKLGEIETVFVRINEYSVEKVRIGVATVAIENGDQLANLTYVAKGVNTWKNRDCSSTTCSHSWNFANDVLNEDNQIVCPVCETVWVAGSDRFGKIFSYGQGETFVLKNDIDFMDLSSVFEAETWSGMFSTDAAYNGWGFLGTLDGNGHSVYNVSNRLFVLLSNTSVIKNLGVYGNISTGNILSKNNINGKVDNCYFDVYVTAQANNAVPVVADIFKKSNGTTAGSFTNSFVNVRIDENCSQEVYAIGKNIDGADLTNTYVVTTAYDKNTAVSLQGTPSVNVKALYGEMNQTRIKEFLAQQNINHGAFINDDGVLKFAYTRPIETIIDLIYPLYKHNSTYTGRVANTDALVVSGFEAIPSSTFTGVKAGDVVSIVLENTAERITTANVKVVTGVISNADEFANMIYLSVDEKPSGNWMAWNGYYVLSANIDMQGKTMKKNGRPGTLFNAPGWGFEGTIDGAGYTVFNLSSTMFYQFGNWGGSIKNLSLINMSKPLATTLGGFTIENCYFEFVIDALHSDNAVFTHVLGDSVGDEHGRTGVIKNSVIKVVNNTETKINLINKINAAGEGKTNSLTYANTILVADNTKVGTDAGEITSKPTVIGLNENFTGDRSVYTDVIWYKEGNYPTFKSFIYGGEVQNKFTYGRFTTVNGAKVDNTADFVGQVAPGVTVSWDGANEFFLTKDGSNNFTKSPGYSLETMLKGSDNKFYKVTIVLSSVAINTAEDLKNMMISLGGVGTYTPGGSQVVMLNGDIDMSGITDIVYSDASLTQGSWGFLGTFDGNGYTVRNFLV